MNISPVCQKQNYNFENLINRTLTMKFIDFFDKHQMLLLQLQKNDYNFYKNFKDRIMLSNENVSSSLIKQAVLPLIASIGSILAMTSASFFPKESHPIVHQLFESLGRSGIQNFYESGKSLCQSSQQLEQGNASILTTEKERALQFINQSDEMIRKMQEAASSLAKTEESLASHL